MSKLVLVTGASGFLASHIIERLLSEGYRVRGTARGKKLEELRQLYASKPDVELVQVEHIAEGTFPHVFDSVDAVIHTASPLSGRADAKELLHQAAEGTLNVLRQGEEAGITKFVVTSSIAAVLDDPSAQGTAIKSTHWSPITREQALAGGGDMTTYRASKKFAELALWDWAGAHPHVDITTILPPFLYGPFAEPSYIPSHPDPSSLSTNGFFYRLLTPDAPLPPPGGYIDVRDAARAHVGALSNGSATNVGADAKERKRVVLASPHEFSWGKAAQIVQTHRPELVSRLNKAVLAGAGAEPVRNYDVDFDFAEQYSGLKKSEYYSVEETVLAAVDSIHKVQEQWSKAVSGGEHPSQSQL